MLCDGNLIIIADYFKLAIDEYPDFPFLMLLFFPEICLLYDFLNNAFSLYFLR